MSGHAAAAPRDELAAFQLIEFFKPRQPGPDCRIPNWRGSVADDLANGIIAKRIIELAKAGERNPDLLCEGAIEQLRGFLFGD